MRRTLTPLLALAALAATPAAAQVTVPRTRSLSNAQPVFCVNPTTAAVEDCVGGGGGASNPAAGATGAAVPADGSYTGLNAGGLLKGWTGDASGGGLVAGEGTAGSPAGGVVSVQGVGSGTPVPVSGTFWQATQPVSLASVPSHPVTNAGTFAVQVTSAPTTAVTGTFWQSTQPVSGTFWQSTQPVSIATAPALVASSAIIGKVDVDQTTPGTTNSVQDAADGATGSAVPAKAGLAGAVSSGNLAGLIQADKSAAINVSTATTTQLVALTSGKAIYVTHWDIVVAAADNVTLEYGTGTACATGATALTGAYNLPANGGVSAGVGLAPVLFVPAGDALCVLTSAATQASGAVAYTQF